MEFDCLPEAFDFFNLYSWEVGFGIKYGASRRNKQGSLTMQEFLCGCAGSPRHDKTKSSACGCKAMIRLRRTDDHGWFIHVFRKDHNHSMSLSCGEKMQWPSHKNIDPHTKASLHCRWTGIRCNAACLVDGLGKLPWKPLATDGTGKSILSVAALTLVRHREDCAGAASWAVATGDSHGSGFYIFLYFSIWAHIISQPPVFVSVLHGGHHRRPHIFSGCRRISVVEI
ncbi:hypothetical protein QYE76_003437 [Lolium multiflorum]|nr:hypothetical protein QYE76_003437 [Lolium multiflorum]